METLKFSPASDVWSFGIVVIELLQDGETPYHGMSNPQVMKMTISGDRHQQPQGCSDEVYQVLLACWNHHPEQRPSFGHLNNQFSEFAAPARALRRGSTFKGRKPGDGGARPDEWESAANTYAGFDDFVEEEAGAAVQVGGGDAYLVPNSINSSSSALHVNPVYTGDAADAGGLDASADLDGTAAAAGNSDETIAISTGTRQLERRLSVWEQSVEVLEGMTL